MFNFLLVGLFLELGLVPTEYVAYVRDNQRMLFDNSSGTYAEVGISVETERLYAWTSIESRQTSNNGTLFSSYAPYRVDYSLGGMFYFNRWLSFGVEHECDHAVLSSDEAVWPFVTAETRMFVRFGTLRNRR
ncbi:MAG TPA: hypothetical protein VLH56_18695 [Dissulfurispiraceae bacterium]|nr:hypothetical protein [Dissulfurispiraceae bacterium]